MTAPADLARQSVPQEIAALLLDRILSGKIRPGAPLREVRLADEFEASRNTVREALARLERDGVVRRRAHRGSAVIAPDDDEIADIMRYRMVVEPGAVRRLAGPRLRAAARKCLDAGAPHPLASAQEIVDAMERAGRGGDWKRYGRLDLEFHATLVEAAGGSRLGSEFRRMTRPLYVRMLAHDRAAPATPREHVTEHRTILERVLEGRRARATRLIDQHLVDAESALFAADSSPGEASGQPGSRQATGLEP